MRWITKSFLAHKLVWRVVEQQEVEGCVVGLSLACPQAQERNAPGEVSLLDGKAQPG